MQIEVVAIKVENKGKYRVANVTYKTTEGKVEAKNVMSFVNKNVFNLLSEAKQGDMFEIKSEKNDKGFWEWKEAGPAGKNTSSPTEGRVAVSRSTYETPEERAKKQVYIVRQSSISAALELMKLQERNKVTPADVVELAREFERYVFDIASPVVEAVVT